MGNDQARPFLKWAGGKGQLLSRYQSLLPSSFAGYCEPFLGGGALFFHLSANGRLACPVSLSDLNPDIILAYQVIRDDVDSLIRELRELEPHRCDRDHYYLLRNADREQGFADWPPARRAARTIFLNRTCYNGLYRVNTNGHFNVPFGRYRNPTVCDEAGLRAAAQALTRATLSCQDFDAALAGARAGDFVYCDPPYQPLTPTSFTGYTAASFSSGDQARLATAVRQLADRGCLVMVSNSDTDLVRGLYRKFNIVTVPASRPINSRKDGRGQVAELVITTYDAGDRRGRGE